MNRLFQMIFGIFRKNSPLRTHVPVKGTVTAIHRDKNGHVKSFQTHNAIEDAGKYAITDQLMASPTLGKPTHAGVGTGTPVGGDLSSPLSPRVALTSKTRTDNVLEMTIDLPAGVCTGAITEAGIFDALTTGNCLATTSLSTINKEATDVVQLVWQWQIG